MTHCGRESESTVIRDGPVSLQLHIRVVGAPKKGEIKTWGNDADFPRFLPREKFIFLSRNAIYCAMRFVANLTENTMFSKQSRSGFREERIYCFFHG